MKRNALLVGGFVIIALALIVAAILWLSGNSLFKKNITAMIYYRGNVSGLYVGAGATADAGAEADVNQGGCCAIHSGFKVVTTNHPAMHTVTAWAKISQK